MSAVVSEARLPTETAMSFVDSGVIYSVAVATSPAASILPLDLLTTCSLLLCRSRSSLWCHSYCRVAARSCVKVCTHA